MMVRHRSADEVTIAKITNLEMIHWVPEEQSMRGLAKHHGEPIKKVYETFQEAREAIQRLGAIIIATDRVDVIMFALEGRYEDEILAIRQSGVNVRRFLIREVDFVASYGTFQNCIDHIMSNNVVECEVEIQHLRDLIQARGLDTKDIDPSRYYARIDVDLIAAMQLIDRYEKSFEPEDGDTSFLFSLGYSVGRLFSSVQNLATLEEKAHKAAEYEKSYKERGHKGRSSERRLKRAEDLLSRMEELISKNPAMSRLLPVQVANLALQDAANDQPKLWSQGKGQLEAYLTFLASEEIFRSRYNALFFKTG